MSSFFLITFFGGPYFFTYLADGFSLKNIQSHSITPVHNANKKIDCAMLDLILNQQYIYLGKGSQCFVFQSNDDRYVLKFFRNNRLRASPLHCFFSFSKWGKQKILEKQQKFEQFKLSCKIASELLRDETKLIYLHLDNSDGLNRTIEVQDKLKRQHHIDLSNYEFIIQEKVEPMHLFLKDCKNMQQAKQAMLNLIRLLRTRCGKGIFDKDASLATNIGFTADGQAVLMDIGQFQLDDTMKDLELELLEIFKVTSKFYNKLRVNYPELAEFFEAEMMKQLDAFLIFSRLPYPFLASSI